MGYYINQNSNGVQLPACNKADYLILDGAFEINKPKKFLPDLVCVVENGPFDAALFCYKKEEFEVAADSQDKRPKRWLIYSKAAELSGYKK
jgi:hypothetical protein